MDSTDVNKKESIEENEHGEHKEFESKINYRNDYDDYTSEFYRSICFRNGEC
jgi:hypothetical protein